MLTRTIGPESISSCTWPRDKRSLSSNRFACLLNDARYYDDNVSDWLNIDCLAGVGALGAGVVVLGQELSLSQFTSTLDGSLPLDALSDRLVVLLLLLMFLLSVWLVVLLLLLLLPLLLLSLWPLTN